MANLAPSWRPKTLPNRGQNLKKSMLKINTFSASIFEGFGPRFGRVLGWFLEGKMHENRTNMLFAKTWKTLIFLRENWYFQGFDAWKYQRFGQQWHKKLSLLWNIDLGWIFEGFWDGFGKPKSFIFQLFSTFFWSWILKGVLKAKIWEKNAKRTRESLILGRAGGMCGVLGREKERGSEACWDRILEKLFSRQTL